MFENEDFLKSVTALTNEAKCKLTICTREQSMEDRWVQVRGPGARGAATRRMDAAEGQGTPGHPGS